MRPKKIPTMVPISAPQMARELAPTRLAPSAEAATSTTTEISVSTPNTVRLTQPMRVKSSTAAATTMPANISGTPGKAGNTMPAAPMTMSAIARIHSAVAVMYRV